HLKKEGFSGFQIQIIGTQLWDAGAIMAFDAARLGSVVPPLPRPPAATQGVRVETADGTIIRTGPGADSSPPIQPVVPEKPAEEISTPAGPVTPTPATPKTGEEIYSCTKCFGTVSEKEKSASNLFFNKTLCRNCFEKERITLTKERDAQAQEKNKGDDKK
ncbi:hypothetical protein KKH23_10615, partial [Patescibacteria group bacterium]|nr:hypothetical protein [Patescibacteria group bacterium]